MKRYLLAILLAASLACGACSTSYKPAPSTIRVNERASAVHSRVVAADSSRVAADQRTAAAAVKVAAAKTESKGVAVEIDAAMTTLDAKDYTSTAQHLIKAKVGSAIVQTFLDQTLEDLKATRTNLATVGLELGGAKTEIAGLKLETGALQSKIDKATTDAADDHVVAKRCKSWFGLGAIFYGVERLLTAGIWGILIFSGIVIAAVAAAYAFGGPLGGAVLKFAGKGVSFIFTRRKAAA